MLLRRGVRALRLFGRPNPIVSGYEDNTGLHSTMSGSIHIPWHPEEMKKYSGCLSTRSYDGIRRFSEKFRAADLFIAAGDLTCQKWCYDFQCSGRDPDCEARTAFFDDTTLKWTHGPKPIPSRSPFHGCQQHVLLCTQVAIAMIPICFICRLVSRRWLLR
mmetsp:Transcript_41536/g.83254  ORF Transcript_41536/g.83254 Transcript_41536/m.83254 type:complete len:160 (-) Transcript_41536:128-607(-)